MVIILGLGFTGKRLARRLLARGLPVSAVVRGGERFADLADKGLKMAEMSTDGRPPVSLPKEAVFFHSIPPLPPAENVALRTLIVALQPARIVYISSTGVYGDRTIVDENTPAQSSDDRGRARIEEEQWISSGPWSSLILRAAAIYGPGRGVHSAIRAGKPPRSAGSGVVSRIHVDDLAALADAALFSKLQGAWPVADDAPCPSSEIIAWCKGAPEEPAANQASGRSVDGTKIRRLLNVELVYQSWRTGVPASLAEERELGAG